MLWDSDERFIKQLHPRLAAIVVKPQPSDRRVLVLIIRLAGRVKAGRARQDLWKHFESTFAARVRPNICELHRVFDELAATIEQSAETKNWIEGIKAQYQDRD
jgi:hypothetical protein